MPLTSVLAPPENPVSEAKIEYRRVWIGNLDPRVTEYQLLKLLQKFGPIEKFDLLFHKTGPLAGQPRGYAFVTYTDQANAESMKQAINGKLIGSKQVSVSWAHTMTKGDIEKPKVDIRIPALIGAKEEKRVSRASQIQAIESKLKMMEHNESELLFMNLPSTSAGPIRNSINLKNECHKTKPFKKKYSKVTSPYKQ